MENFLSCDWGTTSFRLRLIEAESLKIIEEQTARQGIAETFQQWKLSGENERTRLGFYLDIISKHITTIEKKSAISLKNLPLVVSGMASSTIGMIDLPYKEIPFSTTGKDLEVHTVEASEKFKHKVVIISGVRTDDDVMRGEETKLVGCYVTESSDNQIYIFPGTHPKHIQVKGGIASDFKTYMTGELFELLSKKSILSVSVKEGGSLQAENNLQSFAKGVKQSMESNLLHNCFLVRTNDVFRKLSIEENYFYLSGLLIGSELKDLTGEIKGITVVANEALRTQYMLALDVLKISKNNTVTEVDADTALIRGQKLIYGKMMASE